MTHIQIDTTNIMYGAAPILKDIHDKGKHNNIVLSTMIQYCLIFPVACTIAVMGL